MDKKKYFSQLVSLYEAVGMAGTEEVVPQENIADTGIDAGIQGADPNMMGDSGIDPNIGMPAAPQVETPEDVMMKEKLKKLFDLMDDLHEYGEIFYQTLDRADLTLVDYAVFEKVLKYRNNLKDLLDKIDNYMINVFNVDTYEKVLYTYLLFRTELVTTIKGLRDLLDLKEVDKTLEPEDYINL